MIDRRALLMGTAASVAASMLQPAAANGTAPGGLRFGQPLPFSFEQLTQEMRELAARAFVPDHSLPQAVLERIDYDAHGRIHFDPDDALFRDGPGQFPVTFFALGAFFRTPVRMYVLDSAAEQSAAREILYDPRYFSMPADSPARELPANAGFAGFRLQESRLANQHERDWRTHDWVAFLGAAYFRAIGELYQYGLSARGIAIDVAMADRPEEFPSFTRFYFVPPAAGNEFTVYAALEGPSLTGAYRFGLQRSKAVLMEVEARLFLRRDVARLGIAPLTSMYWFSETAKPTAIDWRPEVHDSDGLALWNGAGERIWRPLNNPPHLALSTFIDRRPRGFGLLQRDRRFDHYLDGVHYERRPSLWVEPLDDWGAGSVQLVELSTSDEIHDNIVAMWVPASSTRAGEHLRMRYRLYWGADEPHPPKLARCIATRLGRGGEPGQAHPKNAHRFVVEFLGGPLAQLPPGTRPKAVLHAATGSFANVLTEAFADDVAGHWRAQFDFTPAGEQTVDIRLFLQDGNQALSETWLYQFHPT